METLQRQEEELKTKLEDAATIVERRQIRAELKEVRNKIANFALNKDENANIVETKNDINANNILPKKDMKSLHTDSKIIDHDTKEVGRKRESDYRVTDDSEQLRIKTADERANRRARRQERMAKLAKEQTDESSKIEKSDDATDRSRRRGREEESTNGLKSDNNNNRKEDQEKHEESKVESRPRSYLNERKADSTKEAMKTGREETKTRSYGQRLNVVVGENNEIKNGTVDDRSSGSTKVSGFRRVDRNTEDEKHENFKIKLHNSNDKSNGNNSFGSSSKSVSLVKGDKSQKGEDVSKPDVRYHQSKDNTTIALNSKDRFSTNKTERREERTVAVGVGDKLEQIEHTVESRSTLQNGQQVVETKKTTSRVSSALDRFSGSGSDKTKAVGTIGRALGVGSARNKFLNADKAPNSKPIEFGLNYTKKSDKPGYTVKKYTETKIEEKSTSSGQFEFGLSFQKKEVGVKSNLRETQIGSVFKKDSPSAQRRHLSAPAATGQAMNFKLPGGGSKSSSVADRMKMFKESEEDEKARIEKQKQKEIQQRARLASDPTPVKSPASSTAPCMKKREVKKPLKRTMSISNIVLDWCKEMVKDYGIEIKNFSGSWSNGLAFCALIHKFNPDKFDFNELDPNDREGNFRTAFDTAFEVKNIPKLLDVEDMVRMAKPEPRSVQCYVQWIWSVYGPISGYGPSMEEIKQAQVA